MMNKSGYKLQNHIFINNIDLFGVTLSTIPLCMLTEAFLKTYDAVDGAHILKSKIQLVDFHRMELNYSAIRLQN